MNCTVTTVEFKLMQRYIEEKSGIRLGEEKIYLVESRLAGLLAETGLPGFDELYRFIVSGKDLRMEEKVVDAITTNETLWFRDKTPWLILEDILLPFYVDELRKAPGEKIRIWSAACSTGQEPYSIAMCIDRYLSTHKIADISLNDFEIIASDISESVLQIARTGKYDSISITRGLDENYKGLYFTGTGRVWNIDKKIRDAVMFRRFNLRDSLDTLGKFDIIFLRYALIYFSESFKKDLLQRLTYAMRGKSVLFIGSSELIPNNVNCFSPKQYNDGIYFTRE